MRETTNRQLALSAQRAADSAHALGIIQAGLNERAQESAVAREASAVKAKAAQAEAQAFRAKANELEAQAQAQTEDDQGEAGWQVRA